MPRKPRTDLEGILVGSIMKHAPPLVFYLYSDGPYYGHTRVVQCKKCARIFNTVQKLAQTYNSCVTNIWINCSRPRWYFLQLKEDFGPEELCIPALPWSVYTGWESWLGLE